jgi:hypothetical protein
MRVDLHSLAARHCALTRFSMKGFILAEYGISYRTYRRIATGKKHPSPKFLGRLQSFHTRVLPSERVEVEIPNHPVLIPLGHPTNN